MVFGNGLWSCCVVMVCGKLVMVFGNGVWLWCLVIVFGNGV